MTTTPDATSVPQIPSEILAFAVESEIYDLDELLAHRAEMDVLDVADKAISSLDGWLHNTRDQDGADKARAALLVLAGQLGMTVEIAA